jgi:hypothetical protein
MSNLPLRYVPWIGATYATQSIWPGLRLVVVGESHHHATQEALDRDDTPLLTVDMVKDACSGQPNKYFEIIPRILSGATERCTSEELRNIWSAIAFCNMAQEPAYPTPQSLPNGALQRSQQAVRGVLTALMPTHVLFISESAWSATTGLGHSEETTKFEAPGRKTLFELWRWKFDAQSSACWSTYTLHPTSGRPPAPIDQCQFVAATLLQKPAQN